MALFSLLNGQSLMALRTVNLHSSQYSMRESYNQVNLPDMKLRQFMVDDVQPVSKHNITRISQADLGPLELLMIRMGELYKSATQYMSWIDTY